MIKFIASDLDGTLLLPDKTLPDETFPLIRTLKEKGVLFAPASGRQYANLKNLFAPVADQVLFIAENGALVVYRDEVLFTDLIPKDALLSALQAIRSIDGLYPMFCSTDYAYIEDKAEPFHTYAYSSYDHCKTVDDLEDVIDEPICKIAIYDAVGSAINCMKRLPDKIPFLRTIQSGVDWCDVSSLTASKGEAIEFIREKFGFTREECVAFGDHMNDYEMLLACGKAFVPENAFHVITDTFPDHIPSPGKKGAIGQIQLILEEL